MSSILMIDSTLRDGSHAVQHQLSKNSISLYAESAEKAHIPIIIVGHGNGLGASSVQVGISLLSDQEMIEAAKEKINNTKLGVYAIPGFATVEKDIKTALNMGVDVVSIGCHCTEADTTKKFIEYTKSQNKLAYVNLMMVHMVTADKLLEESLKAQSYGASGITLMDSAGALLPQDVTEKISTLTQALKIPVGFHAHNNLGLSTANSLAAVNAGATILDSCILGFGAGAGNAQFELLVALLEQQKHTTGIDLYKVLDLAELAKSTFVNKVPTIEPINIVSGLAGVFSGFTPHVKRLAKLFHVDERDIFFELGKKKAIAGQEDLVLSIAEYLQTKASSISNKKN